MRGAILTLIAAAIFWSSACGSSAASDAPTSWPLVFSDDFEGTHLDTTKWTPCYWWVYRGGCTNSNNHEQQWYTASNIEVWGGSLRLRARKQTVLAPDGKAYSYTSGLVSTGRSDSLLSAPPKFQFKYGYTEMRAKTPRGAGLWSAFWTLPSDHHWPPEIDVMETRGDRVTDVNSGVHNRGAAGEHLKWATWFGGIDHATSFHTYGVDWQPTYLAYYVDGVERARVTDPALIPNEPMYLLANLAVGGNWPGSPTLTTPFPSDLEIDYIRVYQEHPDTEAPDVTMTSPRRGAIVKRGATTTLAASARDDVGVERVDFYAGSKLVCSDSTAPYRCRWKARTFKTRQTFSAKAYDVAWHVGKATSKVRIVRP